MNLKTRGRSRSNARTPRVGERERQDATGMKPRRENFPPKPKKERRVHPPSKKKTAPGSNNASNGRKQFRQGAVSRK